MAAANVTDAELRQTVNLIRQPLLVEVLHATASKRSPDHHTPQADFDLIRAAIDQLVDIGAVEPVNVDSALSMTEPLTLTMGGRELIRLLGLQTAAGGVATCKADTGRLLEPRPI